MTDPNIKTLTDTIYDLNYELAFERKTRKEVVRHNYLLSKENEELKIKIKNYELD